MSIDKSQIPPWIHGIGGCGAGLVATLLLHPLDVIKVRFQSRGSSSYGGISSAFRRIVQTNGVRGLYDGLSPNLLGNAAAWGAYFFFYTNFKQLRLETSSKEYLEAHDHLFLAACAGAVTSVLTNPIWLLKTRMILQNDLVRRSTEADRVPRYRNMAHAAVTIVRDEGPLALFKGLSAGLVGVSHGAMQFMAYEYLKSWRGTYVDLQPWDHFVLGAASKVFAVVCTYPYQVIRTRLQERPELRIDGANFRGFFECAQHILRTSRLQGFYAGTACSLTAIATTFIRLVPAVLRVTPHAAVTFTAYEYFVRFINERVDDDAY